MAMILAVFLVLVPHSQARKVCPSIPWNWPISELALQSNWVVIGKIKKEIPKNGQVIYQISPTEVLKGDAHQATFETKPFVIDKKSSIIHQTDECQPAVSLDIRKEFIFFSENRNVSAVMELTEDRRKMIRNVFKH